MEQGESLTRSIRLTQIQHFLHKNPRGLTTRELAGLCGVSVRTIQRDIATLQAELGVPLTQNGDNYGIMEGYNLPPVFFSLYEAMALFLASRLVLRQSDENNAHINTALTKLAGVLPAGPDWCLSESIKVIGKRPFSSDEIRIFEQVAVAWSTRRRMKIFYQSIKSAEPKEWLLEPYFVDMTGVGYSIYVLGRAVRKEIDEVMSFKFERIKEVELLEEVFEIPAGFDFNRLLFLSWGIMLGEETEIKLRFSQQVTRRVKESIWHPTQIIEDLPDGGCLLTVRVGGTLEITPWIRSWGPDVEVLEPEGLRQEFCAWAARQYDMYKEGRG